MINRYASTYAIRRPQATHMREATCAEVECAAYINGWVTTVDPNGPLGDQQLTYLRTRSGRHFVETARADGHIDFTFPAGQTCFNTHQVALEREPVFLRLVGSRGPRGTGRLIDPYRHTAAEHWVEDFMETNDKLHRLID